MPMEASNDNAVTITITAIVITPKVTESVLNVPGDSGIYFLLASNPMIAIGANDGQVPSQYQYNAGCYIPENIVITQTFKATSIIGIGRSEFIQHFRKTMIRWII